MSDTNMINASTIDVDGNEYHPISSTKTEEDLQDKELGIIDKEEFQLDTKKNRFAFLMFGVGMLLPWNAMLAAMDFFTESFPSYKPSFSLIVAVSAPTLVVQAIVFGFLRYIPL